jgi:squalene synthase HpnC
MALRDSGAAVGGDATAVMARAAGENFPVASRVLPRAIRADLLAIYGFARLVDDVGDEGALDPGERLARLDGLERELDLAYQGRPAHPIFVPLAPAIRRHGLPKEPFRRLIEANRRDQTVTRYPTFADLVAYCELSANPVGHLVLSVLGASTPARRQLSDRVCTGLQLVEHWQDVRQDLRRGRIYLPQEDLRRFGVDERDLAAATASARVRRLIEFEVGRARRLLDEGAPLAATLQGRQGLAVAGFVGGGRAALASVERAGFDVLAHQPHPSRVRTTAEIAKAMASAALGRARGRTRAACARPSR